MDRRHDKRFGLRPSVFGATQPIVEPQRMTIRNDAELEAAVTQASRLLQEIQDYVGRDQTPKARVRFPRGYLRTTAQARQRLSFLPGSNLKSNVSYTMMLSDVQHWVLSRTDLAGTAKDMVIKLQLFLLGSIVESVTTTVVHGNGGSYKGRTKHLKRKGIISEKLRSELDWLWDIRNRIHLFGLDNTEWLSTDYTIQNHNRGVRAFSVLLSSLSAAQQRTATDAAQRRG
ncbi:MAG: hypothetical protein ACR2RB_08270 [Gammaproteobacteria bacterium]